MRVRAVVMRIVNKAAIIEEGASDVQYTVDASRYPFLGKNKDVFITIHNGQIINVEPYSCDSDVSRQEAIIHLSGKGSKPSALIRKK